MPAEFTLGVGPFPAGTTVGVYTRRTVFGDAGPVGGVPVVTAVTSALLTTAFTGLAFDTEYWAAAQVGGVWRKVAFATQPDGLTAAATLADLALKQDAATAATDAELAIERARVLALESTTAVIREAPINALNPPGVLTPAVGNGTTDDYAALNAMIAAVPAAGGAIYLPQRKNFKINTGLFWDGKPIKLFGDGPGNQPGMGTRITAAPGIAALHVKNGSSGLGSLSEISGLRIIGSDAALGTNDGLLVQAGMTVRDVLVENFGRYGVYILSSTGAADVSINANVCRLDGVQMFTNYGGGLRTLGTDSNAGTFTHLDFNNNGSAQMDLQSTLGNHIFGVHLAGGALTTGGIKIGTGGRNRVYGVYYEEENKPALTIDAASSGINVVEFSTCVRPDGANPIVDNSGAINYVLIDQGGQHWTRLIVGTHVGTGAALDLNGTEFGVLRGATLRFQNAAADTNWTESVLADGRKSITSPQGKPVSFGNPLQLPSYTTAGRPSATAFTGQMIYVSDGAAGAKFQGSDGAAWVNLG